MALPSAFNATPKHTVPTGLPGTAPPGPAIPVMDTESCAPECSRAPQAISRAVSQLTAPNAASVSAFTPSISSLARFVYVIKPRSYHSLDPGTAVISKPRPPPCNSQPLPRSRRAAWLSGRAQAPVHMNPSEDPEKKVGTGKQSIAEHINSHQNHCSPDARQ